MAEATVPKEKPQFMVHPDPKVEEFLNVIMKKCLWQFHSRAWDRTRQNQNILLKTMQLLCGEPVDTSSPSERCYWVDAVYLADTYKAQFPWLKSMGQDDIKALMKALHEKLEYITVSGSLNLELKDEHY